MSYRFYSAILVCLIPFIADARLPDFTDLVEEASSAVVKINVSFKEQDRLGLPSYRGQLPDIFRELLEQQRRSQQDRPQRYSMGSGFVISEEDMKIRGFGDILGFKQSGIKNFKLADPVHNSDLFLLAEKEMRRIENSNQDISKFKPLIKLYDRADIINDIA